MKKLLPLILSLLLTVSIQAQDKKEIYDPTLDGMEQIDDAIELAAKSDKNVLVQLGGNWCPWCIRFHNYVDNDEELKTIVDENYVVVLLNNSPENKNLESMPRLGYPQRFGYPVFIILDKEGNRIHTQNSGLLEEGKSYNRRNVLTFFKHWTPKAIDPESYKKK